MQRRRVDRLGAKLAFDKFLAVVHQFGVFVAAYEHVLLHRAVLRKENAEDDTSGQVHDARTAGWPGRSDRRAREGTMKQGSRRDEDEPENGAAND